ncbi:MAG TPA: hypothetical protein VHQ65_15250 [Thermoanaerobaculia bacterium]|nr:hypothetical protein [Thermoanaerobaculia bacterium]
MRKTLYALTIALCAALVGFAVTLPMETAQAEPPENRGVAKGHATAEVVVDPFAREAGTCNIDCGDETHVTDADNAGDCACDCADRCGTTCTATGGGQTATCGPAT